MGENRMCTCMCNWVTLLYSRKKKLYWGNKNFKKSYKYKNIGKLDKRSKTTHVLQLGRDSLGD